MLHVKVEKDARSDTEEEDEVDEAGDSELAYEMTPRNGPTAAVRRVTSSN